MTLRSILQSKGHEVYTTTPETKLSEVAKKLVHHQCGSLLVCDGDRLAGIITERDLLRVSATDGQDLESTPVSEVMTGNLVTGTPNDSISQTMGLLTEQRIRHLPILEDDKLVGIISIGDVVKAQYAELTIENHYLKSYILS